MIDAFDQFGGLQAIPGSNVCGAQSSLHRIDRDVQAADAVAGFVVEDFERCNVFPSTGRKQTYSGHFDLDHSSLLGGVATPSVGIARTVVSITRAYASTRARGAAVRALMPSLRAGDSVSRGAPARLFGGATS